MTYAWLSLIFLVVAAVVLLAALGSWRASRRTLLVRWRLPIVAAGVVVMILTAVFDNVMIQSGLMAYASGTTSGLLVGVAPVEDFAYPLAGLILLPSLWLLFGRRGADER
ncbi:lycopene cyclase domain-containing protein [Cryobacterium psychrophilum]|uniref:Lycopene cyclase domain-containing protein n=1 Tax=Cryobacterium psychrophilum TaxID=41988 RepID=A0A4Y8KXP0_9MICO|nr:lycopene cyclase domain-containing protein [Cryobacterium psychrophilum]TDW29662.1 lycopene cyclase domain-containing protein [Cryobacterium psychrophilum]TFD81776.1 lycopene cyclase domain-containing protein [Cryobacterium psychrophilum]